jgi:hypothetical protein
MPDLSAIVRQLKKERADAQQFVARLDAALQVLGRLGTGNSSRRGRRKLSLAARKRIASAQRARWAKVRKQKAT